MNDFVDPQAIDEEEVTSVTPQRAPPVRDERRISTFRSPRDMMVRRPTRLGQERTSSPKDGLRLALDRPRQHHLGREDLTLKQPVRLVVSWSRNRGPYMLHRAGQCGLLRQSLIP